MESSASAEREKRSAALTSLIAAIGLTTFKIIVGTATGSLGILAEATHSALDLIAALVTVMAIRVASKPADREHLYGHGKIENLSALFETGLLVITCGWFIYAALQRMISGKLDIEVNVWSFVVMITSIVIDSSRARVLSRAAKKHHSQALEADALHFQTDIWSSAVVIVGLVSVKAASWFPSLHALRYADSLAALGVAIIVIYLSFQMGMRTIHALMDTAPTGLEERIIAAVEAVPGVSNCHNVRGRYSGAAFFADIHVLVDGDLTVRQAHNLTEQIEQVIQHIVPGADVTVHPEPVDEHPQVLNPRL